MKRELSLQLLARILPDPPWTEDRLRSTVEQLRVLADHKYNKYEMYQPARLFFENLYLFLNRLTTPADRTVVLEFVRDNLIFVTREEFQQLAHILNHDCIRQRQLDFAADLAGVKRHKIRELTQSAAFKQLQRSSLYVALSDGARVDYFRRQNLDVSNEQVLAAYYVGKDKLDDIRLKLADDLGQKDAKFDCLFLLDDFCGSGRTLLREVVTAPLKGPIAFKIPIELAGLLSYDAKKEQLEWAYRGPIDPDELQRIEAVTNDRSFRVSIEELAGKAASATTQIKGSLVRIANELLLTLVSDRARVYFSPLLATEYALSRLKPLLPRLPVPLNRLELLPAATLPEDVRVRSDSSPIAAVCRAYYTANLGDEHTGNVEFGYDGCGLPLVLHHNTPNNSLYFLWARKWIDPLFIRYERHGREVRS